MVPGASQGCGVVLAAIPRADTEPTFPGPRLPALRVTSHHDLTAPPNTVRCLKGLLGRAPAADSSDKQALPLPKKTAKVVLFSS